MNKKSLSCELSENISNNTDYDSLSKQTQIERYCQDTLYRRKLCNWVMWIVPVWLIATLSVIIFSGTSVFSIDTTIQNTLLATTTIEVIGLGIILLKGIFPESK